jgi:hypothetical protein
MMFEAIDISNPMIQAFSILLGIIVLVIGRKLFWLTVGAVGFVIGLGLALQFVADQPAWITLGIALLVGAIGAIVAIVVQRLAVGIAGFLMGAYALLWLLQEFNPDLGQWEWLALLVGGIIGSILVSSLFDLALILLSSLAGATLIVQVTNFEPLITAVLFFVLLILGIVVQTKALNPQPVRRPRR